MSGDDQKQLLLFLADTIIKSWWTVIAGLCVGAAMAVVALHFTPDVYEARATITADVERLPDQFVARTISDNVEIQLRDLRNEVLSEANLRNVIEEFYGGPSSEEGFDALTNGIVSRVALMFSKQNQTISILYRDWDPFRAAAITNTLAEFFVLENKELRAASAKKVRATLESISSDVETELQEREKELHQLLANHPYELESQRRSNEEAIADLQRDLKDHEKTASSAQRRLRVLEAQHESSATATIENRAPRRRSESNVAEDPRILQLQGEVDELLRRFTENHPDVVAKRREIDRMRSTAQANRGNTSSQDESMEAPSLEAASAPPELDIWDTRLKVHRLEIASLEEKCQGVRGELARYQSYVVNTSRIQQQVDELTSRIQILRQQYLEDQRGIATAKTGIQLEEDELGNPFVITGLAGPPTVPVWPNRSLFLGAGVASGLLIFVCPLLAKGLLRPTITSEISLSSVVDIPILVAIPVIPTPNALKEKKWQRLKNIGLSMVAASVLGAVIGLHYLNWL